jgi:hypothetical protein
LEGIIANFFLLLDVVWLATMHNTTAMLAAMTG